MLLENLLLSLFICMLHISMLCPCLFGYCFHKGDLRVKLLLLWLKLRVCDT